MLLYSYNLLPCKSSFHVLLISWIGILMNSFCGHSQSYDYKSITLNGMGFVDGIVSHPVTNDIYVRTDVGGAYHWDSADERWIPLTDNKGTGYGIESIAVDPSNASNLYIASMDSKPNGSVFKSTNKGVTWQNTGLTLEMDPNGKWRYTGERLKVDPNNNGLNVYFGSKKQGLWKSSDAGLNWSQIPGFSLPFGMHGGITFVCIDPTSGSESGSSQVLYAAVQGEGVFKSTDEGSNWSLLQGGPDVAFKPTHGSIANDGTLYVAYGNKPLASGDAAVYKYTGSGNLVDITPSVLGKNGMAGIHVSPAKSSNVITFHYNGGTPNGIHYSTNGGSTWSQIPFNSFTDVPDYFPSWHNWTNSGQIMFDPKDDSKVWLTTGFGVYKTDNINGTPVWDMKMTNLEELVATLLMSPPVDNGADVFLASMDMGGFVIENPDVIPSSNFEPEVMNITTGMDYCVANPLFAVRVGSGQHKNFNFYGGYTTNNGATWNDFPTVPAPDFANGAIAISSTNPDHWVWAPANDYWDPILLPHYTLDGGETWNICNGLPAQFNGASHMWAASTFLASDRVDGSIFYYYVNYDGNWGGNLYRSNDGGVNWSKVNASLPQGYRLHIHPVPGKENELFITFETGKELYYSLDGGSSFETINNVDTAYALGFGKSIDNASHPALYLSGIIDNKLSLYRSADYGATWTDIGNNDLPLDHITNITGDLRKQGVFYFGTRGRGFFYAHSDELTSSTDTFKDYRGSRYNKNANVYPNPSTGQVNLDIADGNIVSVCLIDVYGKTVYEEKGIQSDKNLNLAYLSKGLYFMLIKNKSENQTIKFLKN